MRELPRAAAAYVSTVILAGAFVLWHTAHTLRSEAQPVAVLALFLALAIVAELRQLQLSYRANYSVGVAVCLASAVICGVGAAVWDSAIAAPDGDMWKRKPLYKTAFNAAAIPLATFAAGSVMTVLRVSPDGRLAPEDLPALAAYTGVHLLVNQAIVSIVIGLATRTHPWQVALANYRGLVVPIVALYPLGVLMAVTYLSFGGWVGLALLAVPTVAVYSAINKAQELRRQTQAALEALADALDCRDHYTAEHSHRVGQYADGIATVMRLPLAERELLVTAARVHDLGKISVPDAILRKPGQLDERELEVMREHPRIGAELLQRLPQYREHAKLVMWHHERIDGDGYPDRLPATRVPLGAQILAVADAFDAMTSDRPYRKGMSLPVALDRLRANVGTQFRADVVEALATTLERTPSIYPPHRDAPQLVPAPAPPDPPLANPPTPLPLGAGVGG